MTALNAAILFNSTSGSDTQSSGSSAGANVYGSGASTSSASAIVTGIVTTGVQSGDLLWVQSSSGRQFSVIASVDSGTQVTCDDTFANTESSRTWAIGGKRATFDNADSRRLLINDMGNWTVATETDQTLSSSLGSPQGIATIVGVGEGKKTITCTGNFSAFSQGAGASRQFRNLKFLGSASNTSAAISGGWTKVVNCQFGEDGGSNNFLHGISCNNTASNSAAFKSSFFGQGSSVLGYAGYRATGGSANIPQFYDCLAKDFNRGLYGVYSSGNANVARCIFIDCSYGVDCGFAFVRECLFYNIANDAIKLSDASQTSDYWVSRGGQSVVGYNNWGSNVFSSVQGYAINAATTSAGSLSDYGADEPQYLHSVTSGVTGLEFSTITLTADPFVSASTGDFNLNADAGGGATLRANNFSINTDTAVYPFRQYVSDDFGGGGGSQFHPLG